MTDNYRQFFSPQSLWKKFKTGGHKAGRKVVETALVLHYTASAPETPVWCKTAIYGALGYFISLIDGVPDITPIVGYTDDFAVMIAATATLSAYITQEIKDKAARRSKNLFASDSVKNGLPAEKNK